MTIFDLYESSGTLRYNQYCLILDVDQEIVEYYRALMPKSISTNRQMYGAHISIIRKETPARMDLWGKYEGEQIDFKYNHAVRNGTLYYWLDAFSKRLEEIRLEIGLSVDSPFIQPPRGYNQTFHITLGNIKEI